MAKTLEIFKGCASIVGFRAVKIKDVDRLLENVRKEVEEAHVQLFDAKLVASKQHLHFAAMNASRAFEKKSNISSSIAIETILYASAQRQIKKAVDMLGIKPDSSQIAVLIVAENKQGADVALEIVSELISGKRDDSVLELTADKFERVKHLFSISDLEIEAKLKKEGLEREALVDLVIEHMALLATQR